MFLSSNKRSHGGFTIVEMLIAMAVTLLMMVALGRMFQSVGRGMQDSRANVEMSAKLRTVTFTLNNELSRCTAMMKPPLKAADGAGYLTYYDGPMSDASTLIFTGATGPGVVDDIPDYRSTSRYGDFDDYLAFTAVAADDAHFSGVVPEFLVLGGASTAPMTITSKYAEIVYWVRPVFEADGTVVDRNNDGLPDRMNLHKRVLLIRPDLNVNGLLPGLTMATTQTWPANYRDMVTVFQNADLSMRRPLKADGMPGDVADGIAANSLSDLTLPHNRFAHVRVPGGTAAYQLGTGTSTSLTSMPVLDLNGPIAGDYLSTKSLSRTLESNGGLLKADYALSGLRTGEDVLLSNVLAFDVRSFDPQAPVLIHVGADGTPGLSGAFGELGSDDVVLTPTDPGFRTALEGNSPAIDPTNSNPWQFILASRGAFVDLDYVYKAGGTVRASATPATLNNLHRNINAYCDTAFSGFDVSRSVANYQFRLGLYKSGRHLQHRGFLFYQPAYDTFALDYEYDGYNQGPVGTNAGTVWYAAGQPSASAPIDEGNNNLDDGGSSGVDDDQERETGPPVSAPLRALQVQIRIDDQSTRQSRQMVVTQEFVD